LGSVLVTVLTGLAEAGTLFLVGAGLTLIFGSLRLINVAHGSFYMYAAFVVSTIVGASSSELHFWGALIIAPLVIAALGVLVEVTVMRRLYRREHLSQMLATFGLFYVFADLGLVIWGSSDRTVTTAPSVAGSLTIFGQSFPEYSVVIILVALVVGGVMFALLRFTTLGWKIRAAVEDNELLAATGVNVSRIYLFVFTFGALLAGIAGAIAAPQISISAGLDQSILIDAFIISVIGGLGSISGAAVAAVLIGLVDAFGARYLPSLAPISVYVVMIVVLVVRPSGIFGRAGTGD
jgi:branched-subunit amino acid ABC-type transport system permease component